MYFFCGSLAASQISKVLTQIFFSVSETRNRSYFFLFKWEQNLNLDIIIFGISYLNLAANTKLYLTALSLSS